jgi:hypothetical protein
VILSLSRIKTPGEKKRLSLTRDHRNFPWHGNKSFRSSWREKKVVENREFRRMGKIAVGDALSEIADTPRNLKAKPKRSLHKTGVYSLGKTVVIKTGRRIVRHGIRRRRNAARANQPF